jgi:hypothetical protein
MKAKALIGVVVVLFGLIACTNEQAQVKQQQKAADERAMKDQNIHVRSSGKAY